jgi:hypothetical protein
VGLYILFEFPSRVHPDVIHELVMGAVYRRGDQLPDDVCRGVLSPHQQIGDRDNAAVQLLADRLVVMLDDQGAADIFYVYRHALAVWAMRESRREMGLRVGGTVDVLEIVDIEEPIGNINVRRGSIDMKLGSAFGE